MKKATATEWVDVVRRVFELFPTATPKPDPPTPSDLLGFAIGLQLRLEKAGDTAALEAARQQQLKFKQGRA